MFSKALCKDLLGSYDGTDGQRTDDDYRTDDGTDGRTVADDGDGDDGTRRDGQRTDDDGMDLEKQKQAFRIILVIEATIFAGSCKLIKKITSMYTLRKTRA